MPISPLRESTSARTVDVNNSMSKLSSGASSRRSVATSNPSRSGISRSSRMIFGGPFASTRLRAARPLGATVASIPHFVTISCNMRRLVALSSTMRTDSPSSTSPSGENGAVFVVSNAAVKRKVDPTLALRLTSMRPFINSMRRFEMASPRPVPPYSLVVEESACSNASKMRSCFSAEMPMPVSRTLNSSLKGSLAGSAVTSTSTSPSLVNLTAFPTRFTSTWRRRFGSPMTMRGTSGATRHAISRSFSWARTARPRSVSERSS